MKEKKYLHRLTLIMLLGLMVPVLLFFLSFQKYTTGKMEQTNENFYEKALETYTVLLDKKIHELEMFAAKISAGSKEYNSELRGGCAALADNAYQMYRVVQELREKYGRNDVSEWGIYFYDLDKIITPEYTYTLDHFLCKYVGQSEAYREYADFFSEENYSLLKISFGTTNTSESVDGNLLAGVCTRIGENNDRVLIFYVLSPEDISESLAIVGGEGITYYLLNEEEDQILLVWGDVPEEGAENIPALDQWERISGVKRKSVYNIGSDYPQLAVRACISGDSMQGSLIDWAMGIRRLLLGTVVILLCICFVMIGISYKPVYELVNELDYSDGNEFELIRYTLNTRESRIVEQEMLILDLLINHLIYGIPVSEKRIRQLGIGENVHYYCVFLVERCFLSNSEVEKLVNELEKESAVRILVTDWHEENSSIVIAFLKEEDISGLQLQLERWLKENYVTECFLYAGKVVDKPEDIQSSFRACLGLAKKGNEKKQKSKLDADTLTPKAEQQKKMKEEILAYLEVHYREPDLSQVQVADLFRISNYTLSRLFKNQVGVGFAEYLTSKRLEYAKELLLTTSCTVREISTMAGFSSENYFSRTFKLYEGVSPSSFRKR